MLTVKIEDNSEKIEKECADAVNDVLFAWGVLGVKGCVEMASAIDEVTGRPTVDTGRYRAAFGFVTPVSGGMSPETSGASQPQDNITGNRAERDTVIIANNVEYAPYLEFGTGSKEGGHHARYIMKRGIESQLLQMKKDAEQILKGQKVDVGFGGIKGG